jgi:hypothetical protein
LVAKKLLKESHPELRAQFQSGLNAGVSFDDLYIIFDSKVFWKCESGHLILQKPRWRTQGKCPQCFLDRNRKYLKDYHQNLISEFDVEGNEGVDPGSLYSRSPGSYSWICRNANEPHTYMAKVGARIKGHSCSFCAGIDILPGFNDWMTLEPLDNLLWNYEKNLDEDGNQVDPMTLGLDNRKQYKWTCVTGNHERIVSISSAVQGKRLGKECRICAGYKCVEGVNDAFTLYPTLRSRLHSSLNKGVNLGSIHPGSRDVSLVWACENNHTWERSFPEELKSKGCGKCGGKELWEGHNDLLSQHPELATEIAYDLNANLEGFVQVSPEKLHKNSGLDSWWRCAKHGHTWKTKAEKRTRGETGCPFCSDRRVWPGFNDLWTKRPDLVDEIDFDKHPGLDPKKLLWVSHDEINWRCAEEHRWPARLHLRSSNSNRKPTGCPSCAVSGFKPEEPAIIYFIENQKLMAFKVGITNSGTQRLKSWLGRGWELIEVLDFEIGAEAKYVEKRFHFWRRRILEANDFLTSKDVGRLGGWTETFSIQSVTSEVVKMKLREVMEQRRSSILTTPSK